MKVKEGSPVSKSLAFILMGMALILMTCAFCTSTIPLLYSHIRNLGIPPQTPVGTTSLTELEQRVAALEKDQNSRLGEIAWALDQKLYYITGAALFISSLAAFLGWKSYKDLDGVIQEKIRTTLDNELYQLDPANLTVRLPIGNPDTLLIRKRLELSGLHNLVEYLELNKQCLRGLTIVPVNNLEEEQRFCDFLAQEQPNPEMAAFVLYTTADPREFRVSVSNTLNNYERVATANMPATVITAALAISRGLHREK